jgi:antitoxin (DNA-binding transcriptional repressor) of toxin-antitoxin stability system
MDEVAAKRQAVIITKRGKPVAKLVPVEQEKGDIFGFFKSKGKIEIKGDIVSPAFSPEEWGDLSLPLSLRICLNQMSTTLAAHWCF